MSKIIIQWDETEEGIAYKLSIETDSKEKIEVTSGAFLSAAVVNLALSSGTSEGFLTPEQRNMVYEVAAQLMKEADIEFPE